MTIKTDLEAATVLNLIATAGTVSDGYLYIAFYSNFPVPTAQDLRSQKNEIGRLALSNTLTSNLYTGDYTMGLLDCICPTSTVVAGTNTTTNFKVNDYTKYKVNDRVQVGTETDRMVTAVNSGTHYITLDAPLSAIPANGTNVNVKISQRAILRGGTSGANTGALALIEQYILYKTSLLGPIAGRMSGNIT